MRSPLLAWLKRHFDWPLFLTILAIAGLGLVNLYSATRRVSGDLFGYQIWWMVLGVAVYLVMSVIDYRVWHKGAWVFLFLGVMAVLAVYIVGVEVKGSRRWLGLGPLRVQPSELLKVVVILAAARLVHDRDARNLSFGAVLVRSIPFGIAFLAVAVQPDLGTATLIGLLCVSVVFLTARRLWPLLTGALALAAAFPVLWRYVLHDYQKQRILTFLDPTSDPSGAGWHARQSILAIGSGQLSGKGYMEGTQNQLNFLPEQWTDFPFSVWAEEWGFVGSVILLGLYLFLIFWILNIASETRDRFGAVICSGAATLTFWHILVNICMVTGLAPVVGVTLPLVSYGGSSVLTFFVTFGLVSSVSIRRYAH